MMAASASRPRLLVVAGPNGAGKTTITERGLAHEWFHDCEYVNPDAIAQDELGDWNDAATVLRAAQLATERRPARVLIPKHDTGRPAARVLGGRGGTLRTPSGQETEGPCLSGSVLCSFLSKTAPARTPWPATQQACSSPGGLC